MIVEAVEDPLTNFEVFAIINEEKNSKIKDVKEMDQDQIRVALSSASLKDSLTRECDGITPEGIELFLQKVMHFDLTEAEILQIINTRPNGPPVLYTIIEDCDERYDDDKMDELLQIIHETVGSFS